jgi:hypothetical protein
MKGRAAVVNRAMMSGQPKNQMKVEWQDPSWQQLDVVLSQKTEEPVHKKRMNC